MIHLSSTFPVVAILWRRLSYLMIPFSHPPLAIAMLDLGGRHAWDVNTCIPCTVSKRGITCNGISLVCHRTAAAFHSRNKRSNFERFHAGTEVYVYGPKSENGGILSVTLDTTLSMVDRWLNYESDCSGVIFWQNELPNTRHTLKIAFDGPSPSNKTGDPYVEIQYIR